MSGRRFSAIGQNVPASQVSHSPSRLRYIKLPLQPENDLFPPRANRTSKETQCYWELPIAIGRVFAPDSDSYGKLASLQL